MATTIAFVFALLVWFGGLALVGQLYKRIGFLAWIVWLGLGTLVMSIGIGLIHGF